MKKVSLLTNVVGFKYITRNKVGSGGYEFLCGDSKKIHKFEITW
jgi:hypothetical protein